MSRFGSGSNPVNTIAYLLFELPGKWFTELAKRVLRLISVVMILAGSSGALIVIAPDAFGAQQFFECQEERLETPQGAYISSGVDCQPWNQSNYSPLVSTEGAATFSAPLYQAESPIIGNMYVVTVNFPYQGESVVEEVINSTAPEREIFSLMRWRNHLIVISTIIVAILLIRLVSYRLEVAQLHNYLSSRYQQHKRTVTELNNEFANLKRELSAKGTLVAELQSALLAEKELVADLQSTLSDKNKQIEQLQDRAVQMEQQIKQVRKENLWKILATDQDQLIAMYNSFVTMRRQFEDLLTIGLERLELSEELMEGLDRLLKAQRGMMAEIQGNGQGELHLKTPIPDDPYEFLGVDSADAQDVQKIKGQRKRLLNLFHPDKVHNLNIEWVTQLFTKISEEINVVFDKAINHPS